MKKTKIIKIRKEFIMKKMILVSIILSAFLIVGLTANVMAQQNNGVPVLMQQNPTQVLAVPLPPGQAVPIPPPPPGIQGIQVTQTIPVTTLMANLPQALQTIRKLNKLLTAGKVWLTRGPGGELDVKAGLLYQGVAVAVIRFNPLDGNVLPLGLNQQVYQSSLSMQTVKAKFSSLLPQLKILPVAEFIGPETCWSFPVVLGNTVVTHVKIYYNGMYVLPDYPTNQEMMFYGQ
jgi:hypothetical protein